MTSKAQKLLRRMRESQANWKPRDLRSMYRGFGFEERQGRGSHLIVIHPVHRKLRGTIPIHGEVSKYVVKQAIENIDLLLSFQDTSGNKARE